MRNAAARSNLLVPEVREVMDIRTAFKLGNRWRFKRSRLDEWMDHQSDLHAAEAEIDPEHKKPVRSAL